MNKELYRLKQQAYGQKAVMLPQGAVSCIIDMLPNPNDVATGRFTADQLLALNAPENVRKYHYVLNGDERCSERRQLCRNLQQYKAGCAAASRYCRVGQRS